MRRGRGARSAGFRDDEREARGAIAAALWVESVSFGVLFGAVGGFVLVVCDTGTWSPGWLVFAALGSFVVGGGLGFVIGQIVGLTLALIATAAPARSRIPIVRVAIPLVALSVSVTPVVLVIGHLSTNAALFTALDVTLTLTGAALIRRRFLRLEARWERVIEAHRVH
jgi:hypothetical protein